MGMRLAKGAVAAALVLAAAGAWAEEAAAPAAAGVAPAATAAPAGPTGEDPKAREEHHPMAEAPAAPKISGFIASSYSYDLNDPSGGWTMLRSYDAQSGTARLNTAHVVISGAVGEVNYTVETDAGSDAAFNRDATFANAQANSFDIQEAYVTFKDPIAKMLGLDETAKIGKFVTYDGIEVIESPMNPTITRGYLFGLAEPFTHVGFVKSVPVGPATITVGAVNGWDKILDNNDAPMGLANVNINFGDAIGMINLTGYSGAENAPSVAGWSGLKRNTVDATGVWKFISKVDLWWQVNYGDEQMAGGGVAKWGGAGLQPLLKLSDSFVLGLRAEYFEDVGGSRTLLVDGGGNPLSTANLNVSITPCWNFAKGAQARWEFRTDSSNKEIFDSSKLDAATMMPVYKKSTITLAMEASVSF